MGRPALYHRPLSKPRLLNERGKLVVQLITSTAAALDGFGSKHISQTRQHSLGCQFQVEMRECHAAHSKPKPSNAEVVVIECGNRPFVPTGPCQPRCPIIGQMSDSKAPCWHLALYKEEEEG